MNGLQQFVFAVFLLANIWLSIRNHTLRYPAPKSRREQIARIRAQHR